MYVLYLDVRPNGWSDLKKEVFRSKDLEAVKDKLKIQVLSGVKLDSLNIVKEVPVTFNCSVEVSEKESN